jgi:hypothetical protein
MASHSYIQMVHVWDKCGWGGIGGGGVMLRNSDFHFISFIKLFLYIYVDTFFYER